MKTLKEMPKPKRTGRKPKYDYDSIIEKATKTPILLEKGSEAEVKNGKADFSCTVRAMRHSLYSQQERKNIKINTAEVEAGDNDGRAGLSVRVLPKTTSKSKAKASK